MSSDQQTQEFSGATSMGGTASDSGDSPVDQAVAVANDRPEVMVGAAFAGGFLAAMILKRLVG